MDESDREFLMSTAELNEYWKERYRSEGQEQGVKNALRTAYTARFGPMPEDIAAIVAVTHDEATLSRWLELIVTSTPEEVTRAVRGSTSS
jgi:hypothetical protein